MTSVTTNCVEIVSGIKDQSISIEATRPVLLVGGNGSGKSSVFAAVEFAITGGVSGVGKQAGTLGELASPRLTTPARIAIGDKTYEKIIERKGGKFSIKSNDAKPNRDLRIPLLVQDLMRMTAGELQKVVSPAFEGKVDMAEYTEDVLNGVPREYRDVLMLAIPDDGEINLQDVQQKVDELDAMKRATMKSVSDLEKAIVEIDAATPRSEINDTQAKKLEEQLSKAIDELRECSRIINAEHTIEAERKSLDEQIETLSTEDARLRKCLTDTLDRRRESDAAKLLGVQLDKAVETLQGEIEKKRNIRAKACGPHPTEDECNEFIALHEDLIESAKRFRTISERFGMHIRAGHVVTECEKAKTWVEDGIRLATGERESDRVKRLSQEIQDLQVKLLPLQTELQDARAVAEAGPSDMDISLCRKSIESCELDMRNAMKRLNSIGSVTADAAKIRKPQVEAEVATLKETLAKHREIKAQKTLRMTAEENLADAIEKVEPMKVLVKRCKEELASQRSKSLDPFYSLLDRWCSACDIDPITFDISSAGIKIRHKGLAVDALGGGEKLLALTGILVALNVRLKQDPSVVLVEGAELDADNLARLCDGLCAFPELDLAITTSFSDPGLNGMQDVVM